MEQPTKIIVNEITIKGQTFANFMNFINDLPHRYGKQLEQFVYDVARENAEENTTTTTTENPE